MDRPGEDRVAGGWNPERTLRWIEAGRLRLEEDADDGAVAVIQGHVGPAAAWMSATELVGLVHHLRRWFRDDPAEVLQRIEAAAAHVKTELEAWDARARLDEEHPPYAELVRALTDAIAACRRLREEDPFAGPSEAPT